MSDEKPGFSRQEKFEHMRRLQNEGLWEQALAFKESLRQSGQSNDVSFAAMLQLFSPLPEKPDADWNGFNDIEPAQTPEEAAELAELIARCEGQSVDLRIDIEWAYLNSNEPNLSPSDAPTPGAWTWLQFSKQNRGKFIEIGTKYLHQVQEESSGTWKTDGDRIIKVIEKIRESLEEEGTSAE